MRGDFEQKKATLGKKRWQWRGFCTSDPRHPRHHGHHQFSHHTVAVCQFCQFWMTRGPNICRDNAAQSLPVFFMFQCNAQLQFNWTLGPASPGKTFKRKIHRLKYSYDTESHNKPWELSARGCCNHGKIKNSAAKVQSVIPWCSVEQCSVEQCVIAVSLEGRKPFAGQIYGRGMAGGRKINCNTANFKADTILPPTQLTNRK